MGFLKHLRSKSRLKDENSPKSQRFSNPARYGRDFTQKLSDDLISKILIEVCPHTQDNSYIPSENSAIGEGCMLCDLRDLAKSASVCRKWYNIAQNLLLVLTRPIEASTTDCLSSYSSVRIDAVHYCQLEEVLAEKRKRKSFLKSSVESGEVPAIRLSLLCRTVRESPNLATKVELLKLPYMTRETCKGDLARTVSALPNLQYVDLPDGIATGDPSCQTLLVELQARCPEIRRMSFRSGSEHTFETLHRGYWQNLQVLEISGLSMEPSSLRIILGSFPVLHELSLSDLPWLDDTIFMSSPMLPEFPPLHTLSLEDTPLITTAGLTTYLSLPQNREVLSTLSLNGTGIAVTDIHAFLFDAANLIYLAVFDSVSRSIALNLGEMPTLASISLQTIHFEITDSDDAHGLQRPSSSYYAYLARSIHTGKLPALDSVYVRDAEFPEMLLLPPPRTSPKINSPNPTASPKPFSTPHLSAQQFAPSSSSFTQSLSVYTKPLDELDWILTLVSPPQAGRQARLSTSRPLSTYSAARGLGPQWSDGGSRKSVMVGNGFGGFLAVPVEDAPFPRPSSAASNRSFGSQGQVPWGSGASVHSLSPSMGGLSISNRNSPAMGSEGFLRAPPAGSVGSGTPSHHRAKGSRHDLWR